MSYQIVLKRRAEKEYKLVKLQPEFNKIERIFKIIEKNPCDIPPLVEKLVGRLGGIFLDELIKRSRCL
jgi:Txe/YoeB family toxin of Txe-Axe toxin-antitoxin module